MPIYRPCDYCGATVMTYPSRVAIGWGRFCSQQCMGKWAHENNPSFRPPKGQVPWNKGKKASKPAWNKGMKMGPNWACNKGPQATIRCVECRKQFTVPIRRAKSAKYCSTRCHGDAKSRIRGVTHPLWTKKLIRCEHCGGEFYAKPAKLRMGEGRFCSRQCVGAFTTRAQGGRESSIERAVAVVLDTLGESYKRQYNIGPYAVDFYLPQRNLIIECDGDYWHSRPERMRLDKKKDEYIKARLYTIVRLAESDIRDDAERATLEALAS